MVVTNWSTQVNYVHCNEVQYWETVLFLWVQELTRTQRTLQPLLLQPIDLDLLSLGDCVGAEVLLTNLLSFSFVHLKEGAGNIFFPLLQCVVFLMLGTTHRFQTTRSNLSLLLYINVLLIITTIRLIVWAFVIVLSSEKPHADKKHTEITQT